MKVDIFTYAVVVESVLCQILSDHRSFHIRTSSNETSHPTTTVQRLFQRCQPWSVPSDLAVVLSQPSISYGERFLNGLETSGARIIDQSHENFVGDLAVLNNWRGEERDDGREDVSRVIDGSQPDLVGEHRESTG